MQSQGLCEQAFMAWLDTQVTKTADWLHAPQVKCMLPGIRPGAEKVEAVVSLFCRLVDPENLWTIIYALKGLEQSSVMNRLGLKATFNPKRCSHHFLLDWGNPEHLEVGRKLNDLALKVCTTDMPRIPCPRSL